VTFGGGRSWWAHLNLTRINIALTIPKNQVEELMEVRSISDVPAESAPSSPALATSR
jgi:hypothetical protein